MTTASTSLTMPLEERRRADQAAQLAASGPAGLDSLLGMLSDPSWAVRRVVVAQLAGQGDQAIPALCEVLTGRRDDEAQLAAAVDALVASTGEVHDALVGLIGHPVPEPAVLADVAQVLGRRREPKAVPTLVALGRHADDNVAVAAVEALGRIGGRGAVESLIETVGQGSFFRTFPAIDVLGRSGDPRAVEPLGRLLATPHFAPEAIAALGKTGDPLAVAPLVGVLRQSPERLVRLAAQALSDLAERRKQRYGDAVAVQRAVRQQAAAPAMARRLIQSLAGADAAEEMALSTVLGMIGSVAAVPALTRLLDGAGPAAPAAAAALRAIGEDGDAQLVAALGGAPSARRLALLPLVTRKSSAAAVLPCLGDPEAAVRAAACETLARLGNGEAVELLFGLLGDANARVAQAAVAAIQTLGSVETEGRALAAARSGSGAVRRAAFRILSYFGYASALPLFIEALEDADARVRDAAIQGLPLVDHPGALEQLLAAAAHQDERIRAPALRALGQCQSEDRVVATLVAALEDVDPWARYYAAQALGRLGVEDAAAPVARRLSDEAGQVRVSAIEALSHLRGELAFEALREACASSDPDVQRAALVGMGLSRRAGAAPLLLEGTRSTDPATRLVATSAIAELDAPEALVALEQAARDPEESVRTAAIGLLGGRSGEAATRALVRILDEESLRPALVTALARGVPGRVAALLGELATADDERAALLVSALVRSRLPEGGRAVIAAATLPHVPARKAAVQALPALNSRDAFAALEQAAHADADPEVRRISALLLAH